MRKMIPIKNLARGWVELLGLLVFLFVTLASLVMPLVYTPLGTAKYAPAFNAALSVGTGGLVSFLFYYLVNYRSDRRRRNLFRGSVQAAYTESKRAIAQAIIMASWKGGRSDLRADSNTIDLALTVSGFRSLFEGGRESHEGYYAFQNEMISRTPGYDEIIFNLRVLVRATERLIDNGAVDDKRTYELFVRLGTTVERIERNGPGYDESKLLCAFIWEVFAGWNFVDGDLGYDPIQQTIDKL